MRNRRLEAVLWEVQQDKGSCLLDGRMWDDMPVITRIDGVKCITSCYVYISDEDAQKVFVERDQTREPINVCLTCSSKGI